MSLISDWTDAVLRWVSPNEIGFDQKDRADAPGVPQHDDPSKLRFGAWRQADGKYYLGAIGMDVLTRTSTGSLHREEVGFIKLAVDEHRDGDGDPVPMVEFHLAARVGDSSDANVRKVLTLSATGITAHRPVEGIGGGTAPSRVSHFHTDDGRYRYQLQSDPVEGKPFGRIVIYETDVPFGQGVRAVG